MVKGLFLFRRQYVSFSQSCSLCVAEHTIMTEIAGGNHAQFGYYGTQLGDNSATISREEQQAETAVAILTFLNQLRP